MRRLVALLALVWVTTATAGGGGIPSRPSAAADDLAKQSVRSQTWELRALAPDGRRAVLVRFWQGEGKYVEWLWYEPGRAARTAEIMFDLPAADRPGVRLRGPYGHGLFEPRGPGRWLLEASTPSAQASARLTFTATRRGPTIGPLRANGRAGWLSVRAVGHVSGFAQLPTGRFELRAWRAAYVRDWTTWWNYEVAAYRRRDFALLWRGRDVTVVWGVERTGNPEQARLQPLRPLDYLWRGVVARIAARPAVCEAKVRRSGVLTSTQTWWAFPSTRLDASCGRARLAVRYASDYAGSNWTSHTTIAGLARASDGSVGFVEQTVPTP